MFELQNSIDKDAIFHCNVRYTLCCPVSVPHKGGKFVAVDPRVGPVVSSLSVFDVPQSPVVPGEVETK